MHSKDAVYLLFVFNIYQSLSNKPVSFYVKKKYKNIPITFDLTIGRILAFIRVFVMAAALTSSDNVILTFKTSDVLKERKNQESQILGEAEFIAFVFH